MRKSKKVINFASVPTELTAEALALMPITGRAGCIFNEERNLALVLDTLEIRNFHVSLSRTMQR